MIPRTLLIVLAAMALGGVETVSLLAAEDRPSPEQMKFFEAKVRPVLANQCFKCHGPDKQKSSLRLDSLATALKGGESGAAVVPGKPEESLLVDAINYNGLEMPPDGKLKPAEIAALTEWVKMGAPWPGGQTALAAKEEPKITDAERAFWSFQPVRVPKVPTVDDANWSLNPIDRFILQKLQAEALTPAPPAEKAAFLRRASFDLTGLPPTAEELAAFLADNSPGALDQQIDRLLASPRYGERWARHWLDLVRYAESDGWRQDAYRPQAWRYRDYVVRAFNDDKPYDRFVTEQLAGDAVAPHDPDVLVATGFLRHWTYEYNQRDVRTQWSGILNDVTDVTGDVFLGLGMGCARCHDHKFDPILQEDYFRLQAFFSPMLPLDDLPLAKPAEVAAHQEKLAAWEALTAEIRAKIAAIEGPLLERATKEAIDKFPADIQAMMRKPAAERTPLEHQLAEMSYRQVIYDHERIDAKIKGAQKEQWEALRKQLAEFERQKPAPLPQGIVVGDTPQGSPATIIPGDRQQRDLEPAVPTVLGGERICEVGQTSSNLKSEISNLRFDVQTSNSPTELPSNAQSRQAGSLPHGRRLALAQWITRAENPLTARVMVNRVWQYHFGRGLVSTASDFGTLGEKPSHPELLDWLASEFVRRGWSVKELHRLIMTSATYRQSALRTAPELARKKDPENRWLWRMNVRRLDGEQIRDAVLAASGELDLTMGGASVDPSKPRRSIYTKLIRNTPDPLLQVFDSPEGFSSTPQRNVTTTATQSLMMINGEWPLQRAKALVTSVEKTRIAERGLRNDADLVREAWRRVHGAEPNEWQLRAATGFIERQMARVDPSATSAAKPIAGAMPHREGQAASLQPKSGQERLPVAGEKPFQPGDFTVEAFVLLESVYDDASVRTIASHWDGDKEHHGWSLGVTGKKSAYTPRNLVLQLIGEAAGEGVTYEVVPALLHLELNRPYFVAATVRLAETAESGITFYLKDLSDNDAPVQVTHARHKVTSFPHWSGSLVIGGRHRPAEHVWHGLMDDVRLSEGALPRDQLLLDGETAGPGTVGYWRFDGQNFFVDSSTQRRDIQPSGGSSRNPNARHAALVDLCHVLLNSNEFLYVD